MKSGPTVPRPSVGQGKALEPQSCREGEQTSRLQEVASVKQDGL